MSRSLARSPARPLARSLAVRVVAAGSLQSVARTCMCVRCVLPVATGQRRSLFLCWFVTWHRHHRRQLVALHSQVARAHAGLDLRTDRNSQSERRAGSPASSHRRGRWSRKSTTSRSQKHLRDAGGRSNPVSERKARNSSGGCQSSGVSGVWLLSLTAP